MLDVMRKAGAGFCMAFATIVACGSPSVMTAAPSAGATTSVPFVPTAPAYPAASSIAPTVATQPPSYAFADPDRRRKLLSAIPAIEAGIAEEMASKKVPGLATGIVIDGDLVYAKGFGVTDVESKKTPDADTVFRIGSITKSFTALTALALRDEGIISLDDPLVKYVPEATGIVYPAPDPRPITIRHLLTHSSGLPRQIENAPINASEADLLKALTGATLEFAPGDRYSYSNFGYALLGYALARAAHTPYRELVASHILRPLGMSATVWDADQTRGRLATSFTLDPRGRLKRVEHPKELGANEPAGGLYSSVRDISRYLVAQIAAYAGGNDVDSTFVRKSSLREAHTPGNLEDQDANGPRTAKDDWLALSAADAYGYGWRRSTFADDFDDSVAVSGSVLGFRSNVHFLHERGVGVITLINVDADADNISRRILTELSHTSALLKRKTNAPAPDPRSTGAVTTSTF